MLRAIEKEVLENGTYIRFCLCLEEDANTKKLAKDIFLPQVFWRKEI